MLSAQWLISGSIQTYGFSTAAIEATFKSWRDDSVYVSFLDYDVHLMALSFLFVTRLLPGGRDAVWILHAVSVTRLPCYNIGVPEQIWSSGIVRFF